MIEAVIFDLDGTLLDTEKYYKKYWPLAAQHFGYPMTEDMALEIRSLGRPFAPRYFKEKFGEDFDYYAVRAYRRKLMEEVLRTDTIELKPGCIELLTFLRQHNIKTAVATANEEERTRKYLRELGLEAYFDELACASMVEEGKPSPDIYEFACKKVGLAANKCFAVEDSPNGVISASRAGCKVIMVPDLTEPSEEIKDLLFARVDKLTDIENLVDKG